MDKKFKRYEKGLEPFANFSFSIFLAKLANWFNVIPVKILSDIYIFEETGKLIVKFI